MVRKRIQVDPSVRSGKPCICTLWITVYNILNMLADGMSVEEILTDFPKLTREDIFASLRYAADRERTTTVIKMKHKEAYRQK